MLDRGPFKSSRVNTLAWVWGYAVRDPNTLHTADSRFSLRTQKSRRSVQRTQVFCCGNDTDSRVRKIRNDLIFSSLVASSLSFFLSWVVKIQLITSSHETDIPNCVRMILRDLSPPGEARKRGLCWFSEMISMLSWTVLLKKKFHVGRVITVTRTRMNKSRSCPTRI